jgi:hypothetical protein
MGAGGSQQVHDYNPAEENGLFWTIPVPGDSVQANAGTGVASFGLTDFTIDDYGNVGNAISGGKEIDTASLTFRIDWSGVKERVSFFNNDIPTPFAMAGALTGATMTWSASEMGGILTGSANSADFGLVAEETNGVFAGG